MSIRTVIGAHEWCHPAETSPADLVRRGTRGCNRSARSRPRRARRRRGEGTSKVGGIFSGEGSASGAWLTLQIAEPWPSGGGLYEAARCFPSPWRFVRLLTTATSSFGSAGFDRYIWNPAPRMVKRSSTLAYAVSATAGTAPPRSGAKPNPPDQRVAVFVGHGDVGDQGVRPPGLEHDERLGDRARDPRVGTAGAEQRLKSLARGSVHRRRSAARIPSSRSR